MTHWKKRDYLHKEKQVLTLRVGIFLVFNILKQEVEDDPNAHVQFWLYTLLRIQFRLYQITLFISIHCMTTQVTDCRSELFIHRRKQCSKISNYSFHSAYLYYFHYLLTTCITDTFGGLCNNYGKVNKIRFQNITYTS